MKKVLGYSCLIFFALTTLYPLFWLGYTSLKTNPEVILNTFALPKTLYFENYVKAWKIANMRIYFFNSIFVSTVSSVASIFLSALAAFIISRFNFKLKKMVYLLFIIGLLIPVHAALVPLFILLRGLKLLNTYLALILPYIAFQFPINIYILVSFMNSLPKEIEEAAMIDGCSIPRMFLNVILPMCRPAIATIAILNFLFNWNELIFALTFIRKYKLKTLPVGLLNFAGTYTQDYAQMTAGMVIAVLPIIIIYLFLQKQVIKGMTASAVKG